ncbi:hypothetical protein ACMD2_01877 [Ananas comosus]|uniref:3'-5' exonuclease domain-containing protein n=1 Tax=Ananas comosus TaxID=4615 RepID=A0A199VEC4_ANACO|nr:hypothetical protein ACMD2_01877 [Ananas comosus]
MRGAAEEITLEREEPKDEPRRALEQGILRIGDRLRESLVDVTCAYWDDDEGVVRDWVRSTRRDHRRRPGPLVAGLVAFRGLPPGSFPCSEGSWHRRRKAPKIAALRELLADRELSVVGIGMKSAAAKLEAEWGLRVERPIELRTAASRAFGKEAVWIPKHVRGAIAIEGLELEKLATLVLEGTRVEEKPRGIVDSDYGANNLTDEQIMYAARDAYLHFEIGLKCLRMIGFPT